jgi:hypothetical protein
MNFAFLNPGRISMYNLPAIRICVVCILVNRILRGVGFLLLRRRFEAVSLDFVFGYICEVGYVGCVSGL